MTRDRYVVTRGTFMLSLAAITALAVPAPARSEEQAQEQDHKEQQDHKMAAGFMLGRTQSNYSSGSLAGTPESKDTSGGLFVEYDFSKYFGVQSSWWLLQLHDSSNVTVGSTTYTGVQREVTGFTLEGVGLLPLGSGFKLMGKAGGFFWWGNTSGCGDFLCNGFQGTTLEKSNGVSFTWGAALRWDFTRGMGVRIDYDNFGEVYNAKMQTISVGIYALFF
jgi:hypothetical protein